MRGRIVWLCKGVALIVWKGQAIGIWWTFQEVPGTRLPGGQAGE